MKNVGWEINRSNSKLKQKRITLGYAKTRLEGMRMLADFKDSQYDLENCKKTFQEVYDDWSKDKFKSISKSNKRLLIPVHREYLVHTPDNEHFTYRNYYDSYWKPSIEMLNISNDTTPHFCISTLAEAKVEPTVIKTIIGHSGAMSLIESVYTHLDIQVLIDAVNLI